MSTVAATSSAPLLCNGRSGDAQVDLAPGATVPAIGARARVWLRPLARAGDEATACGARRCRSDGAQGTGQQAGAREEREKRGRGEERESEGGRENTLMRTNLDHPPNKNRLETLVRIQTPSSWVVCLVAETYKLVNSTRGRRGGRFKYEWSNSWQISQDWLAPTNNLFACFFILS
jgi:hypothetical protein